MCRQHTNKCFVHLWLVSAFTAAVADFARVTPKMEFTGHEQQQPQQSNVQPNSGKGQGAVAELRPAGFVWQAAGRDGAVSAAAAVAAKEVTTREATVAAGKATAAAAERAATMLEERRRASLMETVGFDGGGRGAGKAGAGLEVSQRFQHWVGALGTCRVCGC